MKSKFGILHEKLKNSGINGNPVITDTDLETFIGVIDEHIDFAEDIKDAPLSNWMHGIRTTVEGYIHARGLFL